VRKRRFRAKTDAETPKTRAPNKRGKFVSYREIKVNCPPQAPPEAPAGGGEIFRATLTTLDFNTEFYGT
jgi:hypothetical protein